jgi:hypothetical protein
MRDEEERKMIRRERGGGGGEKANGGVQPDVGLKPPWKETKAVVLGVGRAGTREAEVEVETEMEMETEWRPHPECGMPGTKGGGHCSAQCVHPGAATRSQRAREGE